MTNPSSQRAAPAAVLGGLAPAELCGPCKADPELFFTETLAAEAAAKAICAACPFRAPCLAWALAARLPYGVAGGLRPPSAARPARGPARGVARSAGPACLLRRRLRGGGPGRARAMQAEMRAARRSREHRRRTAALHTAAVA